jgi:hypothetical protein
VADRVTFTPGSAERIAKVVRIVEAGNRNTGGLPTSPRLGSNATNLRLATFTGNWQTGQYKVVTLHGSTNTASVYNWCNPAIGADTSNTSASRYVIFSKVKGTQSAVEIQLDATANTCRLTLGSVDLTTISGYSLGEIQVLGHAAGNTTDDCSGDLQWYSITTCATATA